VHGRERARYARLDQLDEELEDGVEPRARSGSSQELALELQESEDVLGGAAFVPGHVCAIGNVTRRRLPLSSAPPDEGCAAPDPVVRCGRMAAVDVEAGRGHPMIQQVLLGEAAELAPLGIFVTDDTLAFIAANRFGCEMLG
jgi:hypothetical protein